MKRIVVSLLTISLIVCTLPVGAGSFWMDDGDEPVVPIDTCAKVDTAAILVRMDYFDYQPVRMIRIDNSEGRQAVNYVTSIRFIRSIDDAEGLSAQDGAFCGLLEPSEAEADEALRVMQHEQQGYLSYAYGLSDIFKPMTIAAKFQADSSGFNATSVGTWFIGDYLSEGVIQVEVRAGGTSISDAVPLATGALIFSIPEGLENGRMYSVPLSRPAAIYPDEDFYVIVTYPAGQTRPQGCVMNQAINSESGRYLLKSGNEWIDLQTLQDFARCGWLVNAGEAIPDSTAWLVPSEKASGTILAGCIDTLNLLFRGAPELRGKRYAEVTVTVRDGCNTKEVIPVTFHINEAPFFLNAPKKVVIPENITQVFEIEIYDIENNSFTVVPIEGVKMASFTLSGRILTLTIAPRPGDAGIYNLKLRATDSRRASRDLDIPIFVTVLEQLFDPAGFVFSFMGASATYHISELFHYANGSGLTFQVHVRDPKVIKLVRLDMQTIELIPDELGATFIDFAFLDDEGNTFVRSIPATVGQCKDPSSIIVQKWNNLLLVNNAAGYFLNDGYQWYKNKQAIPRATGQYYSAGNKADDMLDFTASYFVRLITFEGDTVYSCPLTPVRKTNETLSPYPNPVKSGELLTVETGFVASEGEETITQLFDATGRLVQTGRFIGATGTVRTDRLNSGYYVLYVTCKKEMATFGIYVK